MKQNKFIVYERTGFLKPQRKVEPMLHYVQNLQADEEEKSKFVVSKNDNGVEPMITPLFND